MPTYKCTKCGKELVTFRDIFTQFKSVKVFYIDRIDLNTATTTKPGLILCEECGHKFDAWLKEKN